MSTVMLFHSKDDTHLEILADKNIKQVILTKLTWDKYLMLFFNEEKLEDSTKSYIQLRYGDYVQNIENLIPDRSPVMWKDYIPKNYKKIPSES